MGLLFLHIYIEWGRLKSESVILDQIVVDDVLILDSVILWSFLLLTLERLMKKIKRRRNNYILHG
jgi:hypothetical protein